MNICGIKLRNPVLLSSGVLDLSAAMMKRVYDSGAGGVITKSISLKEREGHKNPTVISDEHFIMNAMGLCNPGVDEFVKEIEKINKKIPIIGSVFGKNVDEYIEVSKKIESYVDAIELNLSCPNVAEEMISKDPKLVYEYVRKVKSKIKKPVIAKLSPNVNDIAEIAKAAERGGADAVSAINTLGPGMVIDVDVGKPVLANKFGGVSGPVIKPIAVAKVYEIYEAVKIPIIGVGGISSGRDVIEMMMAGATAVGVGSAVYYHGVEVFGKIVKEMKGWMRKNRVKDISKIVGVAHG